MGLNLSRGLPTKYYSSNRIASLIGNGLMTFIDKRTSLNEIFNSKEVVFYTSIDDLSSKIKFYKGKDSLRKQIARKGKNKYFKLFNEKRISNYILKKSFGKDFSSRLNSSCSFSSRAGFSSNSSSILFSKATIDICKRPKNCIC